MGVRFDQWQADLVRGALGKRADGKYAATVGGVVWSLPRQVGKTFTTGALLFALCAETPGLLILWTAHHTRTAGETFRSMQSFARRPRVAPYVEHVLRGTGKEAVVFRNGSRILFGARDQGFGLGFAAVDGIVFDEAQRLDDQTRMDMVPAANRATNPAGSLLFYIGTPPRPSDKGEAFAALRADALAGNADDTFFVELSADPDSDPDDRAQWRKANPSFPEHTPLESMLRMRKHLGSEEAWRREALGIWSAASSTGVIPMGVWSERADKQSAPVDRMAVGIEVAPDMERASVCVAGLRADGAWHVSLWERRGGAEWVARYVRALVDANPGMIRAVAVDEKSPSSLILDALRREGVRYMAPKPNELGQAHSRLLEGVVTGQVKHRDQPLMTIAASVAAKRNQADSGLWVFARSSATADITPIQAAVLALWAAQHQRPKSPSGRVAQRKVVVYS